MKISFLIDYRGELTRWYLLAVTTLVPTNDIFGGSLRRKTWHEMRQLYTPYFPIAIVTAASNLQVRKIVAVSRKLFRSESNFVLRICFEIRDFELLIFEIQVKGLNIPNFENISISESKIY